MREDSQINEMKGGNERGSGSLFNIFIWHFIRKLTKKCLIDLTK